MKSQSVRILFLAFCVLFGARLTAGEFSCGPCRATWDRDGLTLGNESFRRAYRFSGDALRTTSFVADGVERVRADESGLPPACARVSAGRGRFSAVGDEGLRVVVSWTTVTNVYWVFPGVSGVLMQTSDVRSLTPPPGPDLDEADRREAEERHYAENADRLVLKGNHVRVTAFDFVARTDYSDELLQTREWLLTMREHPLSLFCNVLTAEETNSGRGLVFMRLAPLPDVRPSRCPDFVVSGRDVQHVRARDSVASVANGYPVAELAYSGGAFGRVRALQLLQRALRGYRPGRDGLFLSNTWGDDHGDSRINEEFLIREIRAGAELGVDVVQIDDGWQRGRSRNSSDRTGSDGAWGNFRSVDPKFWEPCPKRLPHGLGPLVAEAEKLGLGLGLWYGPDSTDQASGWKTDADFLVSLYGKYGIRHYKIDSLSARSAEAFANQGRFFDRMLERSAGEMTFDLDVTAGDRPGYFGSPCAGPIFVENRYTSHAGWWPHQTLRNLWSLAQAVDPLRLRIEILDPLKHGDVYRSIHGDDPLLPEKWRGDTVFAIAMMASPLGWFEVSELMPETARTMRPLVARWKRERERMHGGIICPVGDRPDGLCWTGFASVATDGGGYVLLFRELDAREEYEFQTDGLFPRVMSVEVLGGRGTVSPAGGKLRVRVPEKLDFIWLKIGAT